MQPPARSIRMVCAVGATGARLQRDPGVARNRHPPGARTRHDGGRHRAYPRARFAVQAGARGPAGFAGRGRRAANPPRRNLGPGGLARRGFRACADGGFASRVLH
eukprot:11196165-Lingulodinium_polyedra.AAC.1